VVFGGKQGQPQILWLERFRFYLPVRRGRALSRLSIKLCRGELHVRRPTRGSILPHFQTNPDFVVARLTQHSYQRKGRALNQIFRLARAPRLIAQD
jgi:hypothetical protein